jgi:PAS domain S-box-containing protein
MNAEGQYLRALLVEDSEDDAMLLLQALRRGGYETDWKRVETEPDLRAALQERNWDVVFCDYALPLFDAPNAIRVLRDTGSDVPAIIVSGTVGEDVAVESLRLGANDYLLKDNLTRLVPAVQRELRDAEVRRQQRRAEEKKRQAEEALRQSEAYLRQAYDLQRSLFDALPAHIALVNPQGFILAVNAAWEQFSMANAIRTLGVGLGQNYLEVCERAALENCPEARDVAAGLRRVLAAEAKNFSLEYPCHSPTQRRWVRASITPLEGGGKGGAVVMHIDITERKLAEEELARIKMAVEFAADAVAVFDSIGRPVFHNRAFIQILGYTPQELAEMPRPGALFVHQKIAEQSAAAMQATGSWSGEAFLRPKSGSPIELFVRANAVCDALGHAVAYIAVGTDMSKMKRAERTIAEQAALLDHAKDAIMVKDFGGSVRYWNKGAERIFGWTAAEVQGRRVQEFLHEDPTAYDVAVAVLLRQGEWSGEMTKRTKKGVEVLIDVHWTLVNDDLGDPKSILSIETDVTEKRKIEAQFLRAQRMESIGTLAGGIAHDLNNVLGPIIMAVDLFKLKMRDPRDLELLETVEVSAHRGADMVRQVLSFARGIEGRRTLIRPEQLLQEMEKIARDTFPKSITIEVSVPDETWSLLGDATQLHQVLLNLCVNARDAMPRGGRLMLSARNVVIDAEVATIFPDSRPGSYVVLEIADSGEGMPPEVIEKIFEPFFTTKEVGKGTGLGLSTTLAIVRSHGGFIRVESTPRLGTAFKIHLPANVENAGSFAGEDAGELPRGQDEWVLVIDDEASVRSITSQTLEAFGYRVMTASDGADGVSKYAQNTAKITVVLTDMMMPVMDGAATIRALLTLNSELKIIATSGLASKGAEAEAASAGGTIFLPKPYTAAALLIALRDLLRPVR